MLHCSERTPFDPRPQSCNTFVSLVYLFFLGVNEVAWRLHSVLSGTRISTLALTKYLYLFGVILTVPASWASPCVAFKVQKMLWQELQKHTARAYCIANDHVPADSFVPFDVTFFFSQVNMQAEPHGGNQSSSAYNSNSVHLKQAHCSIPSVIETQRQ